MCRDLPHRHALNAHSIPAAAATRARAGSAAYQTSARAKEGGSERASERRERATASDWLRPKQHAAIRGNHGNLRRRTLVFGAQIACGLGRSRGEGLQMHHVLHFRNHEGRLPFLALVMGASNPSCTPLVHCNTMC